MAGRPACLPAPAHPPLPTALSFARGPRPPTRAECQAVRVAEATAPPGTPGLPAWEPPELRLGAEAGQSSAGLQQDVGMPLPSSRPAAWRPAEPGDASVGGQPLPRGMGAGLHPGLWELAGRPWEVGWAARAPALAALTQGVGLSGRVYGCAGLAGGSLLSVLHSSLC